MRRNCLTYFFTFWYWERSLSFFLQGPCGADEKLPEGAVRCSSSEPVRPAIRCFTEPVEQQDSFTLSWKRLENMTAQGIRKTRIGSWLWLVWFPNSLAAVDWGNQTRPWYMCISPIRGTCHTHIANCRGAYYIQCHLIYYADCRGRGQAELDWRNVDTVLLWGINIQASLKVIFGWRITNL